MNFDFDLKRWFLFQIEIERPVRDSFKASKKNTRTQKPFPGGKGDSKRPWAHGRKPTGPTDFPRGPRFWAKGGHVPPQGAHSPTTPLPWARIIGSSKPASRVLR